jgi:pyruvate kinase
MLKKTKIIATAGPACSEKEILKKMIEAGLNVCRLNFSHGTHEGHMKYITMVNELNVEMKENVALLADLGGPKIRVGDIENKSVEIISGDEITITTKECIGTSKIIYVNYEKFAEEVKPGERVLINDGKIVLEILSVIDNENVRTRIIHGGTLSSKKGVNLPNSKLSLPCLTEKDKEDLKFALENHVSWVALSFVRSARDIIELKHLISTYNSNARIIAKIEKPEAIEDIEDIIKESDGIMVARGDLGVEIPMQNVPLIQKELVQKCNYYCKPVIIATQMMESMIESISPTRAEVNDVANAVTDGADAVMLSGETSVGKYPVEVIQAMSKIVLQAENFEGVYFKHNKNIGKGERVVSDLICDNACTLAESSDAAAIVTMTFSGYTAFRISAHRPKSQIFVFSGNHKVLNMLSLVWGVKAFYYDKYVSTDHTISDIKYTLRKQGHLHEGDLVVNIASMPITDKGKTNMLKLSNVE